VVAYATFLVHAGLALLLLPWSPAWGRLTIAAPERLAWWLGEGAVRGVISAVGALSLALVLAELVWGAAGSRRRTPRGRE